MLVVTCPCALALAVPVALTAATSTLAKRGMLTVNSDALETLAGINKTGTLTLGKPNSKPHRCGFGIHLVEVHGSMRLS